MPASVTLTAEPSELRDVETLVVIGRAARLFQADVRDLLPRSVSGSVWKDMVRRSGDAGDNGRLVATHTGGTPRKVCAGILPEVCSRHNTPSRAMAIPRLIANAGLKGNVGILVALSDDDHALASALAVARAHPTYTATSRRIERAVSLGLLGTDGMLDPERYQIGVDAVRRAAHWVDQPPNELTTTAFVQEAQKLASRLGCRITIFRGEELVEEGLGGIWGVGKAAAEPPAMVVLDHEPTAPARRQAWVGKGIVYDTGGLSIKTKTGMPSMKTDMGGAAAVLAGFEAAVRMGAKDALTAVLCIAENAVGPDSTRPDDVLRMYSGKSVEVNNTDAEGRLVLADGTAWVTKNRKPDVLIDMATLTGAQSMATGKSIAALYCSDEALEQQAVEAGRLSGDLVHPLPYAPEMFRKEFSSQIADMRNSVKDRSNGQTSCAGQFIGNHLTDFDKPWLHVDMAGPSTSGGRATGWGVGLLVTLAGV